MIVSLGVAGATKKAIKESCSVLEWDFFNLLAYFEWVVF
jgi:hypothetical protein